MGRLAQAASHAGRSGPSFGGRLHTSRAGGRSLPAAGTLPVTRRRRRVSTRSTRLAVPTLRPRRAPLNGPCRTPARARPSHVPAAAGLGRPRTRIAMPTAASAPDARTPDVNRLVHTHPQRCPPECINLWIHPSRASRRGRESGGNRFVHSVWVKLSTVIHRTPVSCDIRVIWGATIDHSTQCLVTIRGVPSVFPGRAVERVRRAQSVDGARSRPLCTRLWITVDDRPYVVDGEAPNGGRRVGTDRSPTGRATFPQREHGFVHTRFRLLTCADTRFPRIPQPL